MTRVFLSLGSNLPDRLRNLRSAVEMIGCLPSTRVQRQSHVYETEPVGDYDADFLNMAVEVMTSLDCRTFARGLQEIERQLGRREPRSAARTIDLDILLFGDLELADDELTIPHPRMLQRRFVLQPLCDVAAGVMIKGRSASEWLATLRDNHRIVRLAI